MSAVVHIIESHTRWKDFVMKKFLLIVLFCSSPLFAMDGGKPRPVIVEESLVQTSEDRAAFEKLARGREMRVVPSSHFEGRKSGPPGCVTFECEVLTSQIEAMLRRERQEHPELTTEKELMKSLTERLKKIVPSLVEFSFRDRNEEQGADSSGESEER